MTMIMPAAALVLPVFLEINAVHLQNTAWSVILPSAFYPFGVYLAYIYFSTQLPVELLAAGRIDGCSEARLFWSLALPLAKPIIAMVAFFSFTFNWQNFYLPYVMLADDTKYPLTVGLMSLIQSTPALNPAVGSGTGLNIYRPEIALAGLFVVLPIALIFLFAQRYVVAGTLTGAEKG
jgi:multiple sugar transport system permease protein